MKEFLILYFFSSYITLAKYVLDLTYYEKKIEKDKKFEYVFFALTVCLVPLLNLFTAAYSIYFIINLVYKIYRKKPIRKSVYFVKEQAKKLAKEYPNTTIKYYFEYLDNSHYVCIGSREILKDIWDKHTRNIDIEFIKKFPNELLLFVPLEDYVELKEYGKLIYKN